MEFEWDENKSIENLKKHGVDFHEAAASFFDENAVILFDDTNSDEEIRYQLIAFSPNKLLFISYTERTDRIRIISARKANTHHIRIYNEYNGQGNDN
jgi:uncharacterized DUF497 family protein